MIPISDIIPTPKLSLTLAKEEQRMYHSFAMAVLKRAKELVAASSPMPPSKEALRAFIAHTAALLRALGASLRGE